jgi:hypothetical protein
VPSMAGLNGSALSSPQLLLLPNSACACASHRTRPFRLPLALTLTLLALALAALTHTTSASALGASANEHSEAADSQLVPGVSLTQTLVPGAHRLYTLHQLKVQ